MGKVNQNNTGKKIVGLKRRTDTISCLLDKASTGVVAHDIGQYEQSIQALVRESEAFVLKTRELAFSTLENKKEVHHLVNAVANDIYKISIRQIDDIVRITLPMLCPHHKDASSKWVIAEPLLNAFEQYRRESGSLPVFRNVVVVYENVINPANTVGDMRDNDNYEYRQVTNIIAANLLMDDDSASCSFHKHTVEGRNNKTEVYVMTPERFADWIGDKYTI